MRSAVRPGIILAVLALVAGCGVKSERDKIVNEYVAILEEIAATQDRITDQASAEKGIDEVEEHAKKVQELTKRLASLGKPSVAEKSKLAGYNQEIKGAAQRASKASKDLSARRARLELPPDVARRLVSAFHHYSLAENEFLNALTFPPQ